MPALRTLLAFGSASLFMAVANRAPDPAGCSATPQLYPSIASLRGTVCENDGNPCTTVKCTNGINETTNVVDNTPCKLGSNLGACQSGACKLDCEDDPANCKCTTAEECPQSTECLAWTCDKMAGTCKGTPTKPNSPVIMQDIGDCQVVVCSADGKEMPSLPEPTDEPANTECTFGACTADGKKTYTPQSVGKPCSIGACSSDGTCSSCLSLADWKICGEASCPVKLCDGEACAKDTECKTACADGVCCDSACTGECMSCNLTESVGTCSNIKYYEDDSSYTDPVFMTPNVACNDSSGAGTTCNGFGKCLKKIGIICDKDVECISGKCAMIAKVCLGGTGESCLNGPQCAKGTCMMGACN